MALRLFRAKSRVSSALSRHFGAVSVEKLIAASRTFPVTSRVDLQTALEFNVHGFIQQRGSLRDLGLAAKKGLLFYGPPGTGKTHTIQYLAGQLRDHTTLLITSEQVGLLDEYFQLARFLQPAMVVIEDVDLIARARKEMRSACEESLLNKLLNEMDGLREDALVLFILTTNRPDQLEAALASRPGRIDQAIEFPLPDDEGRRKLVRLYSRGLAVTDETVERIVQKTRKASPAFIKELMRWNGPRPARPTSASCNWPAPCTGRRICPSGKGSHGDEGHCGHGVSRRVRQSQRPSSRLGGEPWRDTGSGTQRTCEVGRRGAPSEGSPRREPWGRSQKRNKPRRGVRRKISVGMNEGIRPGFLSPLPGLGLFLTDCFYPRLTPWASVCRRYAANATHSIVK
jgi:DNA polymerase III delta prime subunit